MFNLGYKNNVETVTNSFNSISSNLNYISSKRKYFIYNSNIQIWIARSQDVIKQNKLLLDSELDFLKSFVDIFLKSKNHEIYRVLPKDYLTIFNKGLKALECRTFQERNNIIENFKNTEIEERLQLLFKMVYEIFKKTRDEIATNFSTFTITPNEFLPKAKSLQAISLALIKVYYFEFLYLQNPKEVSFEELELFQFELMEFWYEEFVENKQENIMLLGQEL